MCASIHCMHCASGRSISSSFWTPGDFVWRRNHIDTHPDRFLYNVQRYSAKDSLNQLLATSQRHYCSGWLGLGRPQLHNFPCTAISLVHAYNLDNIGFCSQNGSKPSSSFVCLHPTHRSFTILQVQSTLVVIKQTAKLMQVQNFSAATLAWISVSPPGHCLPRLKPRVCAGWSPDKRKKEQGDRFRHSHSPF